MCDPVSLTSVGLAVATGALTTFGQMQEASAQGAYQQTLATQRQEYATANATAANRAFSEQNSMENIRLQQEGEASAAQKQDLQKEALKRVGTAMASSDSAGLSLMSTTRDINRTLGTATSRLDRNLEMNRLQSGFRVDAYRAQAIDRGRSVTPYVSQPIAGPDYLGAIADVGKASFNAWERRQRGKEPLDDWF